MWGALARFLEARYPPSPWRRRARRRGVPGPRRPRRASRSLHFVADAETQILTALIDFRSFSGIAQGPEATSTRTRG